jgi:hypothetical protein
LVSLVLADESVMVLPACAIDVSPLMETFTCWGVPERLTIFK